jgi:GAF domain-containing protein
MELKVWDESRQPLSLIVMKAALDEPRDVAAVLNDSYFGNYADSFFEEAKPLLLSHTISGNGENGQWWNRALGGSFIHGHSPHGLTGKLSGSALKLGQSAENSFNQHDMELLQLVSGQAAVAIRNAILYRCGKAAND